MPVFNNEALGTMKEFFKKNPKTSFLSKKANDEKPFIFPIMNVHDAEYSSISQKNRFEKNYQTLLNLRCRITSDKDHSREYLKEVIFSYYISSLINWVFTTRNILQRTIQNYFLNF